MAPSAAAGHKKYWKRPWRLKISFGNFVLFLLFLSLFTFGPTILLYLRSNRVLLQKCQWLRNRPLVCAHGGDSSNAPPNTFEAFDLALKMKADCIEIDASQTRDGVLVALHDRDLQAIYENEHIRVGDLTINELKKLNIGLKVQKMYDNHQEVPLLVNAILHVSRFVKQVIIDVKTGTSEHRTSLATDILNLVNMTHCENCVVWSKSDKLVNELKNLAPNIQVGYIVMIDRVTGQTMDPIRMKAPEVVGAFHGIVNTKNVGDIHKAGKRVFAWTVNNREAMEKMLSEGVDGIITNHPAFLHELMLDRERECYGEGFLP